MWIYLHKTNYKLEALSPLHFTFDSEMSRQVFTCRPIFFLFLFSGGSSGIGRGAVLLLSKQGCSVAFGGRNKEELDKVVAQCKETRSDAQVKILPA